MLRCTKLNVGCVQMLKLRLLGHPVWFTCPVLTKCSVFGQCPRCSARSCTSLAVRQQHRVPLQQLARAAAAEAVTQDSIAGNEHVPAVAAVAEQQQVKVAAKQQRKERTKKQTRSQPEGDAPRPLVVVEKPITNALLRRLEEVRARLGSRAPFHLGLRTAHMYFIC